MILMFVQLFKDATAFFSCATPYLAKVIPAMNHIDQHLATAACNNAYKPCIQAAVVMGKKLLNKYYSYTYHSELYWIAMGGFPSLVEYWFNVIFVVLHPSHKLTYSLSRMGQWDGEWHMTAEDIVQAEFERAYADLEVMDSQNTQSVSNWFFKKISSYTDVTYMLDGRHCDIRLRQHLWRTTRSVSTHKGCIGWWADTLSVSTSGADSQPPSVVDWKASHLSLPLSHGSWLPLHSW